MNGGLLLEDKVRAAYHLALLDEPYSKHAAWWRHNNAAGEITAAAALYGLSRPTIIFLLGDADGVQDCLERAELPELAYAAYFPEHAGVVGEAFVIPRPVQMQRMVLGRDTFRRLGAAAAAPENAGAEIVVLGRSHLPLLEEFYRLQQGYRPDPHQYQKGRYLGIIEGGQLLAAAGTHFVSESCSFAMIGNVVTRPDHRRRGLAKKAVTELLARLFGQVETVCLNVRTTGSAAVKLYESLGFTTHCTYYEGAGVLRTAACKRRTEGVLT